MYSQSLRCKYYVKLESEFQLKIDLKDPIQLKLLLKDGFKLALETVRNNDLVFQQNIRYGFIRNLIGGSILGLIGSIVTLIVGLITISLFLKISFVIISIVYLPILFFSKSLLIRNGESFADTVFMAFLSHKSAGPPKYPGVGEPVCG